MKRLIFFLLYLLLSKCTPIAGVYEGNYIGIKEKLTLYENGNYYDELSTSLITSHYLRR